VPWTKSAAAAAGVLQDLRLAVRLLRREPGYVAVAVVAISLGIAATTTLFSVTHGVLLKPLPWPEPGPPRAPAGAARRPHRSDPVDDHERHLSCLAPVGDRRRDRRMDVDFEYI
jgi:hypothetical protein